MSDFFGNSQGETKVIYKPSSHAFTDPLRYFKANDPYHWEVDNIPLRQLQSNLLWLKDQVTGSISEVQNVTRANFTELRPTSTGEDRVVGVEPGRFMGRVNDAYGTGISKLAINAYSNYNDGIYRDQVQVTLPDSVLEKLVGEVVTSIVGNNGLYDYIQTHVSNAFTGSASFGNFYKFDTRNKKDGIYDIPKIKLALWEQDTTGKNYFPNKSDLQQLAVEWTRAWGAPFRTALVNVEKTLSIEVPEFVESDFVNESTVVPAVRVDLLFVYTKPIDASSTVIAKPVGTSPGAITSPQLGLVRGAGVISLRAEGNWNGASATGDFLDSTTFTANREDPDYWFASEDPLDENGNTQIAAPVGDQYQELLGTSGVYGNFPSPDDLMNLAPYVASELNGKKSLALIGQSVLPLAYIFVRKGAATITSNDILDIRPFFRTTELAYNERSGIAAANPPASLANPFVTEEKIAKQTEEVFNAINKVVPTPEYPRPVGAGIIFGGIANGVEGAMVKASVESTTESEDFTKITEDPYNFNLLNDLDSNHNGINKWFYDELGYTAEQVVIPFRPDWDYADWWNPDKIGRAETGGIPQGQGNTDCISVSYLFPGLDPDAPDPSPDFEDDRKAPEFHNWQSGGDPFHDWLVGEGGANVQMPAVDGYYGSWTHYKTDPDRNSINLGFIRKKIYINKPSDLDWMTDYDVIPEFYNCTPMSQRGSTSKDTSQYQGLSVQKYRDYFVIQVAFPIPSPQGAPHRPSSGMTGYSKKDNWETRWHPIWGRGGSSQGRRGAYNAYSAFAVTTDVVPVQETIGRMIEDDYERATGGAKITSFYPPSYRLPLANWIPVIYPTVKFTIIGYPAGFRSESLGAANPTITLKASKA